MNHYLGVLWTGIPLVAYLAGVLWVLNQHIQTTDAKTLREQDYASELATGNMKLTTPLKLKTIPALYALAFAFMAFAVFINHNESCQPIPGISRQTMGDYMSLAAFLMIGIALAWFKIGQHWPSLCEGYVPLRQFKENYFYKRRSDHFLLIKYTMPFLLMGIFVAIIWIYPVLPYVGTGPDRHLDFWAYQQQRVQQCLAQQAKQPGPP